MEKPGNHLHMSPLPTILILVLNSVSATDFVFNGFSSSNLLLYGNATVDSSILTLTHDASFSVGRALFRSKVRAKPPDSSLVLPFSTSFVFSMAPHRGVLPGHGMVFVFVPATGIEGVTSSQNLGFLNLTNNGNPGNHVLGIEFDVFKNQEYGDISDNHVGIDVNSLTSMNSSNAGFWVDENKGDFEELKLNTGENYQVWIDYSDFAMNVTMARAGEKRPIRPLLNAPINLSDVFLEEMYVGFTGSTGQLVESHRVLGWSFSNANFSLSEALTTANLPSFVLPAERSVFQSKGFIAGVAVGLPSLLGLCLWFALRSFRESRRRRRLRRREEMEEWELEYWPHRIEYGEIAAATEGFSEDRVIGIGGDGRVYRGVLAGGTEVAVKRISPESGEGTREFLAEISSLGRLKHRNLVGLRGWCRRENGSFHLVYDYMENGSLDRRLFGCRENDFLGCGERIRVLRDVARGILYLHEGWEHRVLHRDIKASNVLLDKDMNARLGDFGLARIHARDQAPATTRVVGTVGYLDPEVVRTGRASPEADVFGFGILTLEVMCGRRPSEDGKPPLADWAWGLFARGRLAEALDDRLRAQGGFDEEEVERVIHLGLLCACPDPKSRPAMRQVLHILEKNEVAAEESAGEDMGGECHLLEKHRTEELWAKYHARELGGGLRHPTLKEVQESLASSITPDWSDAIVEGR